MPFLVPSVNKVNPVIPINLFCQYFSVNLVYVARSREKKTELLGVKLGPTTKEALERIAEWHDWSISQTARYAIENFVREHYPDLVTQKAKEREN